MNTKQGLLFKSKEKERLGKRKETNSTVPI